MATFVLVHGAFQGGWVWRDVARDLRARGHVVHVPTLSGGGHLHHGLRKGLDLNAHIKDICNYFHFEDIDASILVAHGYSGMIASGAVMQIPHLLRHIVYVDGVIAESNRSLAESAGEAFRIMLDASRENGWLVKPWPIDTFGIDNVRKKWFQTRLCTFPAAGFETPFPGEFDPSAVPASFVACSATSHSHTRRMAAKADGFGWEVVEVNAGHCPMVSHPSELVNALISLSAVD